MNKLSKREKKRDWWKIKIRTRTKMRLKVTEDTMWLKWLNLSHFRQPDFCRCAFGARLSSLRSTFPVPCLPLCHCCLIMLLVNFHMQLRLTTSKAVSKLERKTCQVAEHNNRCKEEKNYYLLAPCRSGQLLNPSLLRLRDWKKLINLKKKQTNKKYKSLIIQTTSK